MPSKYLVRNFEENAFYHVFNRGVEKRKIFLDSKDFKIFIYYLFVYLKPLDDVLKKYPLLPIRLHPKNLSSEVELISYSLMPNHFHFLLRQFSKNGISRLMKQVTNAYTEYFNKRYERTGGLMQGTFKAVRVGTDEQLIHLSRYIHLNPIVGGVVNNIDYYNWSSYKDFIMGNPKGLCNISIILDLFKSSDEYKNFVKDQINYALGTEKIGNVTIDDD